MKIKVGDTVRALSKQMSSGGNVTPGYVGKVTHTHSDGMGDWIAVDGMGCDDGQGGVDPVFDAGAFKVIKG